MLTGLDALVPDNRSSRRSPVNTRHRRLKPWTSASEEHTKAIKHSLTQRLVHILHDLLVRLRRALRCQRHNSFPRLLLLVVPALLVLAQEEVHDLDDDTREVSRRWDYLREEVCSEGVGARAIASFEKGAEEGSAVVLLEDEA